MLDRARIYRSFTIDITVSARAKTEIIFIAPICEIMLAFISFFGEVADFVLVDARFFHLPHNEFVHFSFLILRRQVKPAFFHQIVENGFRFDDQRINRIMLSTEGKRRIERCSEVARWFVRAART